jgi:hypothetical protein
MDTSQMTMTIVEIPSPTQLDPKDPEQRTSSNIRRKAHKKARIDIRASETPDRQSTWEHKRKRWETRQQAAIANESKPHKGYTATMAVTQDLTPWVIIELRQTYYSTGIIFAQAPTPTQSPPRKGRYKIIQRGLWKQPRKIFQRKAQKEETRSRNPEQTTHWVKPTARILSSKPVTQHQQTKKQAALEKKNTTVPTQDQPVLTSSHLHNLITHPTTRQYQDAKEESLHTIDQAAESIQGHPKDHCNEWATQVLQELLSGGIQLSTLQSVLKPIMGDGRSLASISTLHTGDHTIIDSGVDKDCLFATFIQATHLLQGRTPKNLSKLASDLRVQTHTLIKEAIGNQASYGTHNPLNRLIRQIISDHGSTILDYTCRLWTTGKGPPPPQGHSKYMCFRAS